LFLLYALPLAHRPRRAAVVLRPLPCRCGVYNAPTACWKAAIVSSSIHSAALHLPRLCRSCDSPTAAAPFDPSILAAILERARYQWRLPASRLQARRARVVPRLVPPFGYPFASSLLPLLRFDILATFPISGLTSPSPPHRSLPAHCATASIHQCRLALSALVRCSFRLARGLALGIRICQQDAQRAIRRTQALLPSSSTLFPSRPNTRSALLASECLRRLATSENGPSRPDLSHRTVRATRLAALHAATLRAIVPESTRRHTEVTNTATPPATPCAWDLRPTDSACKLQLTRLH
jgi:hypothetical protein